MYFQICIVQYHYGCFTGTWEGMGLLSASRVTMKDKDEIDQYYTAT